MSKEVFLILVPKSDDIFMIELSSESASSFYYGVYKSIVGIGDQNTMRIKRNYLKEVLEDCGSKVFLEDVSFGIDGQIKVTPIY